MKRRLFNLLTVVSLLLCAALLVPRGQTGAIPAGVTS
jgi:hypothetical protein